MSALATVTRPDHSLDGTVVLPDDARYANARRAWNLAIDQWPAAVAFPETAADATATVRDAAQRGLRVVVQGSARARIILILGVLAEEAPGARDAVRESLGPYLDLLAAAPWGSPEYLALLYLLGHFPEDRPRIMAAAGKHAAADPHGISRLERTLRQPDLADLETVNAAGRSWPSPAFLAVTREEIDATAAARRAQPAGQILASWNADTAALLAYAGGLAVAGGA
jgi:hypothetical protein